LVIIDKDLVKLLSGKMSFEATMLAMQIVILLSAAKASIEEIS
jgi:hypothetical protein